MRVDDEEKGPDRTCVATRAIRPVEGLMRFVLDPAGVLTPDIKGKLPGRGVWATATRAAVEQALSKKAFARSLKTPVILPPDLTGMIDQLLAADVRQAFAMANKAGLLITGFSKVEALIEKRKATALIMASDASEDGRRKILQAVMRTYSKIDALPLFSLLPGHELDLALGRENAIHAALLAGPAGDAFTRRCQRLLRYRFGALDETGPDGDFKASSSGPFVREA
ncbi:MAG: RNA-binding protein [Beijerinckiaceae bacterium]